MAHSLQHVRSKAQTESRAAKREPGNCSQTENIKKGHHFDTEAEEIHGLERPKRRNGKAQYKKAVPESCSFFEEVALRLGNKQKRKRAENTL